MSPIYRTTGEEIMLTKRLTSLLFGYFAWQDEEERRRIKEAGSGVFVAPNLGLSARHVAKSFEKLDPQFDALNRRRTPLDPQYQVKHVVSEFASMVYQPTEDNPSPIGEDQRLWKPLTAYGSHDTDIITILVEPRTKGAVDIEREQQYLEWHLLPPPVGSLVRIYGLPDQDIQIEGDDHEVGCEVWMWAARVERHHQLFAHGFADFPVYELHRELPGGFSGAPVIYRGRLAGIFIGPNLVACLWPLAIHTYWDKERNEFSVADHFEHRLIAAWDWPEVKGRVRRVPCSDVAASLNIEPCSKSHVVLVA